MKTANSIFDVETIIYYPEFNEIITTKKEFVVIATEKGVGKFETFQN